MKDHERIEEPEFKRDAKGKPRPLHEVWIDAIKAVHHAADGRTAAVDADYGRYGGGLSYLGKK